MMIMDIDRDDEENDRKNNCMGVFISKTITPHAFVTNTTFILPII